ncbi:MAG: hypothetical protein FWH02_07680 [Oscillospiraceae bacterium]|nr:hypothetical protein [Oscillospiraceae bacterium]
MQLQAYEGYFENGHFYTAGQRVQIPERQRVHITIFDDFAAENQNIRAWQSFLAELKNIDDEPLAEFERVKFREAEI